MAILITKDLCKTYGSGDNAVHALNHVSLTVEEGEFVSIVGTSGSGKSTFLNLAGGLDKPCLLYTSPSPRDYAASRMPSSA